MCFRNPRLQSWSQTTGSMKFKLWSCAVKRLQRSTRNAWFSIIWTYHKRSIRWKGRGQSWKMRLSSTGTRSSRQSIPCMLYHASALCNRGRARLSQRLKRIWVFLCRGIRNNSRCHRLARWLNLFAKNRLTLSLKYAMNILMEKKLRWHSSKHWGTSNKTALEYRRASPSSSKSHKLY